MVCFLMFLMALPTATNGGMYIIDLMDGWAVPIPLLVAALGEIIAITWFFGIHRLPVEQLYQLNLPEGREVPILLMRNSEIDIGRLMKIPSLALQQCSDGWQSQVSKIINSEGSICFTQRIFIM